MTKPENFFGGLLKSLSLDRKLSLLAALMLVPFACLGLSFLSDGEQRLALAQKQAQAVTILGGVWDILTDAADGEGNAAAARARLDRVQRSIQRLDAGPATRQAFADAQRGLEAGESAAQVLSAVQAAMRQINDDSDVGLGAAGESSALQDAVAVRLPEAVSAVYGIGLAASEFGGAASSAAVRDRAFMSVAVRLEAARLSIEGLYREAFRLDPALAERSGLSERVTRFDQSVDALIGEMRPLGASGVQFGPPNFAQLPARRGDVLLALDELWTASAFELDLMIKEKVRQLRAVEGYRLAGLILVLLIAIGFGWVIARTITGPVRELSWALERLRSGDLTAELPHTALENEFGDISRSIERFRRQTAQLETAEAPACERPVEAGKQGDELQKMTAEFAEVVAAARRGDLSHRLSTSSSDPFVAGISRGVNELTESLSVLISNAVGELPGSNEPTRAAGVAGTYLCTVQNLQSDVSETQDRLETVTNKILTALQMLSEAAESVDSEMSGLLSRTKNEAESLRQTSASMEKLAESVRTCAAPASSLTDTVDVSGAKSGSAPNSDACVGRGKSDKMDDVVRLVEEVALQTSILSLNASVEAARAGEAGRCFSVVATDVRALAARASRSLDEMRRLVLISNDNVEKGTGLVRNVQAALTDVSDEMADSVGDGFASDAAKVARARDIAHLARAFGLTDGEATDDATSNRGACRQERA